MTELILLGTAPSCGLPQLSHVLELVHGHKSACCVCKHLLENPREPDRRDNVMALLRFKDRCCLIDMGKTSRHSLLQWASVYSIDHIDAVILSHDHADAMGGLGHLKELRPPNDKPRVYASEKSIVSVQRYFPWLCDSKLATFKTFESLTAQRSKCDDNETCIGNVSIESGLQLVLVPVIHGTNYVSHGFVFGGTLTPSGCEKDHKRVLYISDVSWIPSASINLIDGLLPLEYLIIDGFTFDRPHFSHLCIEEVLEYIERWRPRHTKIVGFSCSMSKEDGNRKLQKKLSLLQRQHDFRGRLRHNPDHADLEQRLQKLCEQLSTLGTAFWRPPVDFIESIEIAQDGLRIPL